MARCSCSGSGTCSCLVQGGSGIDVAGTGSPGSPYVVSATGNLALGFIVNDTPTLDLTLVGNGLPTDPFILSGNVDMELQSLSDVASAPPQDGYVPTWETDHWEFQPKVTAAPGAITAHEGISGDGSALNPLKAEVAGVWGSGPLANLGPDDTIGLPIYLDTNGQLRAAPVAQPILPPPLPVGVVNTFGNPTIKSTARDAAAVVGSLGFTNPSQDFTLLCYCMFYGWPVMNKAGQHRIYSQPLVTGTGVKMLGTSQCQLSSWGSDPNGYDDQIPQAYFYLPPGVTATATAYAWCSSGIKNIAVLNYSKLEIVPLSWTQSSVNLASDPDITDTLPLP